MPRRKDDTLGITILATIFVFSLIVFVHELGHFATAKFSGMQVDEFAIGFGPKIYSHKYGSTVYSLRAIPLGGFNRIQGMTDQEELNDKSYLSKPVRYRLLVISAGAIMNFVLAIVLMWGLMFTMGTAEVSTEPVVGTIMKNSAAADAGIQSGDMIRSIEGREVTKWSDITKIVDEVHRSIGTQATGPVSVVIERNGVEETLHMVPKYDEQANRFLLGVVPVVTKVDRGFFESGWLAIKRTGELCKLMVTSIYGMIIGTEKANLAGPIGVAQLAGQVASAGFVNLLMFTAFLSINLGILNLLPIPLLDGGYIILLLIEGITRRKMPQKALYYIQVVGIAILGSLFIFAMIQDFRRVIPFM